MKLSDRYSGFFLPVLLAVCFGLLGSSVLYGYYIHTQDDTLPRLLTTFFLPAIISFFISLAQVPNITTKVEVKFLTGKTTLNTGLFYLLIVGQTLLLFQPLAKSIRYNVGKTLYLSSIDSMPAFDQPTFLTLGEWYSDRLRVTPINTYKTGNLWNRNKVYLKSFYLIPIFSKDNAYRENAKAWLVFTYKKTISVREFEQDQGVPHIQDFTEHFKRLNVMEHLHFEQYPNGKEKQLLVSATRLHSFFRSNYSNIFEGLTTDRDILSFRYFTVFILLFATVFLSGTWLLSAFAIKSKN